MSILLYNGKIILENKTIDRGYLFIKGNKITSVGSIDELPHEQNQEKSKGEKIDLEGLTILPGLIDIHTHGILDINIINSSEQDLHRMLKELVRYGVTGFLPTTMAFPLDKIINQVKIIERVKNTDPLGSMILGVHLEGPWLSMKMRGAHAKEHILIPREKDIERVIRETGNIVKTVTFSPEIENSLLLTEMLSHNGIIPVIGHTQATYDETIKVIEKGARHVTHAFDAMQGFKEKQDELGVMEPGVETAILTEDVVSVELIGCPTHVPLPFFKLVDMIKSENKKILVTDSGVGTGLSDGTTIEIEPGRRAYIKDGVLRLIAPDDPRLDNGLAGSAVTMNIALKRLVELAGLPLKRAIQWATNNPALLLGKSDKIGSIKPGKEADITVIDDTFNVRLTILKGKIVYRGE